GVYLVSGWSVGVGSCCFLSVARVFGGGGGWGALPPRIPPGVSEGQGFGLWRATFCGFCDILQPKTGCEEGAAPAPSCFAEFDVGKWPKSGIKLCKTRIGGEG